MRLGAYPCELKAGSKAAKAYGTTTISERHRHRFELNDIFKAPFQEKGLIITGIITHKGLCEIVEAERPSLDGRRLIPP